MTERIELYKSDAISSKEEDKLGRGPFIDAVVKFIESQATKVNREGKREFRNQGDPLTIGIYGKWGYGKTSVIRCVETELKSKFFTAYYNPWMYHSEEDLIKHLFETIISSVNIEKRSVLAKTLGKYFLNFLKGFKIDVKLGIDASFDAKHLAEAIERDFFKEETVYDVKRQINEILKSLANPIVIFIDDIDRLSKNEVYTLFKTVRLIADFKNIIYVLSFDDEMVAKSIKDNFAEGTYVDGYGYLEKIIDLPLRLPEIDKHSLDNFFRKKLGLVEYVPPEELTTFHKQLNTVTHYLLESPRDCIKIANSVKFIYNAVEKQIEYEDLILVESIRIKSPHIFSYIEFYYRYIVINNDPTFFKNMLNPPKRLGDYFQVSGSNNRAITIWQAFLRDLLRVDLIHSLDIEVIDERGNYSNTETFKATSKLLNDGSNKIYNPLKLEQYLKLWDKI